MYDLIVIGAGPAGYEAALKAAHLNKKVLLVEKNGIGGTCLNYGCIPTKSLLAQTKKYKELSSLKTYGIECDNILLDYQKMLDNKKKTVDRLVKGIEFLLKKANIDVVIGEAKLKDSTSIDIDGVTYEGKFILIATGSKPATLNIPGFEYCIDSKTFLDKDLSLVKNVIIIGGGVIGVEIATILSNLNIKVSIVEAQDQLILNSDSEVASRLKRSLNKSGVKVFLNSFVKKIEKNTIYTDDKEIQGDLILCSVGRVPDGGTIDPNRLLEMDNKYIKVNNDFQTNISNIYAVGDCVKGWQLAHYATACGINVVNKLFSNQVLYNLKSIPRCIYTSDEIAFIGEEAGEGDIVIKSELIANPRALIDNQNRGFVKLVFTPDKYFKGGAIMCSRASDMINVLVTALNNKLTLDAMKQDVFPHPSFIEEINTALKSFDY